MNIEKVKKIYDLILQASHIYNPENCEQVETVRFSMGSMKSVCIGHWVSNVGVSDLENIPDNEVIFFMWEDDVGNEFRVKITEAGLDAATVVDNNLTLIDDEGDPFTVQLFVLKKMEVTF